MADTQDEPEIEFAQPEEGPPTNNVYTFLLVIAFVMVLTALFLTCYELREIYHVKFGILS